MLQLEHARDAGCDTIAHGCTGKGNDQVRIESTVATLAPELKVIAPVRSWAMGRDEEIAYARKHGIPVKGGTETAPYSIDDNLWGRSSEGRWIEDLMHAPDDDVFQLVTRPELAPDEPEVLTVGFEAGVPVALNGVRLELVELLDQAALAGMKHGVGIVDHIEDRIVGLKVRDIYEVPAAAIILPAHAELERLVGTIHQNQFKGELDRKWAYLVYAGLFLILFVEPPIPWFAVAEQVTGDRRPALLAVTLGVGEIAPGKWFASGKTDLQNAKRGGFTNDPFPFLGRELARQRVALSRCPAVSARQRTRPRHFPEHEMRCALVTVQGTVESLWFHRLPLRLLHSALTTAHRNVSDVTRFIIHVTRA